MRGRALRMATAKQHDKDNCTIRITKPLEIFLSIHVGTIVRGKGHALKNYRVLIPKIAENYPAVSHCGLFGTINVRLDRPIDNRHADHWTPQITWSPVAAASGRGRLEAFGFIKIQFEYRPGQISDAWIILPEGHPWTY